VVFVVYMHQELRWWESDAHACMHACSIRRQYVPYSQRGTRLQHANVPPKLRST
jgi:hypothetical protein